MCQVSSGVILSAGCATSASSPAAESRDEAQLRLAPTYVDVKSTSVATNQA